MLALYGEVGYVGRCWLCGLEVPQVWCAVMFCFVLSFVFSCLRGGDLLRCDGVRFVFVFWGLMWGLHEFCLMLK